MPDTIKVDFPRYNINNSDITIISDTIFDASIIYFAQFWKPGSHLFPPIPLILNYPSGKKDTVYTDEKSIFISSILDTSVHGILDIKDDEKISFNNYILYI